MSGRRQSGEGGGKPLMRQPRSALHIQAVAQGAFVPAKAQDATVARNGVRYLDW